MIDDTDEGRGTLKKHVPSVTPPPELARRVRATLEFRGLLDSPNAGRPGPPARRRVSTWLARAGLIAAGFVGGLVVRGTHSSPVTSTASRQYVLLLYDGPSHEDTGAVHAAHEREYGRWASSLTNGARWVGGHELNRVVYEAVPETLPGPRSAHLAGYFVIEAPSDDRAAEVARSCPHVKYGGRVVVMSIAG